MTNNETFIQELGRISILFATLDVFVTLTLLRLVAHDRRVTALAMNDRTTLSQKFTLFQKLQTHQVTDQTIFAEVVAILPSAFAVSERRNRFIHDLWLFDPEAIKNGKIIRYRIRNLQNWQFVPKKEEEVTLADLVLFAHEIQLLQAKFTDFAQRLPLEFP